MAVRSEVSDVNDPRLELYRQLRNVERRKTIEPEHGVFIAEGHKIIQRALAAGHEPISVLLTQRWWDALHEDLAGVDIECLIAPEALVSEITGFHVHRGALALFTRPAEADLAELLRTSRRLVVLEDLVDHTNVGAIFRSAAALGWDGIVLGPRCADPWYRRSVKVSMGAVLTLPFTRIDDWYGLPDELGAAGFQSVALTLAEGARPIDQVDGSEKLALLVGSEGDGLSARWETGATTRATIPMAAGIDSLNAAASVAIACWALRG